MNNALRARLDELNTEIDEARSTAQRAFKRFEEEREAFAKKGITSTSAPEFKRVKDLHEDYEATITPLRELEQVREVIFGEMTEQSTSKSVAAGGPVGPGSWLAAELKRVNAAALVGGAA